MEYAYHISSVDEFSRVPGSHGRVYIGGEFCFNFILTPLEIDVCVEIAARHKKALTFIIPIIFQNELKKAEECISYLGSLGKNFEVVFNDWGIYRLISKEKNLHPVMGRLLSKQKLGLDVFMAKKLNLSAADVTYLQKSAVNGLGDFLKEREIDRAELSWSPFGIVLDDLDNGIKISIHYPLSYLSTSRYCRTFCAETDTRLEHLEKYHLCPRLCRENIAYSCQTIFPSQEVLLLGNTFFLNYGADVVLKQMRQTEAVDRAVYTPFFEETRQD